ncbi:class I SAM-dependent methyltransferase [Winogradskyella sp. PG-2]|uniref:class I SAM-dependent methyltransferase n=1 Tax=Winogradskyella sp. PG-2 TaxID=754409 RepID=UPI0004587CF6|nr:methyltransferase domain-containing protein [Winogradskyella sp. PG-2]BAO74819.1 methyltransferase [Winogradskyella sp. PG-2]
MTTSSNLIEYFDGLSKTYITNEYASLFVTNYMRRKLIKKVESFENKSVLDIMSGKGENLKYIDQQNNTSITTVDFATQMNKAALLNYKTKTIHQIESDFFEINHKPESYDIILCSFGIKTIKSEQLSVFVEKINHLLKPNGEVLLLELVKPKNYLNLKFIKFYLDVFVSNMFGKQFKALFPYINNHKNMNRLKSNLINTKISVIEHQRVFDLFEIIHAKKL